MIVSRQQINDFLAHSRIGGYCDKDQPEAVAKHLVRKLLHSGELDRNMRTMTLHNGDIVVTPLPIYRKGGVIDRWLNED